MEVERKLSDVLRIDGDNVVARYSWREVFGEIFQGITPRLTYSDYIRLCDRLNRKPSAEEWASMHQCESASGES